MSFDEQYEDEDAMKAGEGFHVSPHHRTGHRPHPQPTYFPIDPDPQPNINLDPPSNGI